MSNYFDELEKRAQKENIREVFILCELVCGHKEIVNVHMHQYGAVREKMRYEEAYPERDYIIVRKQVF